MYNFFLSDPSPIKGNPCKSNSLNNSPTHSRSVDLIELTLACEDANLKLVKIVTVAVYVYNEDRFGNSCCKFGS